MMNRFALGLLFATVLASALPASQVRAAASDSRDFSPQKQRELIRALQSDTAPENKAIACKQLAVCGTKDAVPALAALLSDPRLASWARIALEAIPGPAADAALRRAMGKLSGQLLIGAINSIAVRRDTKAVSGLVKKLKDADPDVATAGSSVSGCTQDPIVYPVKAMTLHYLLYGSLDGWKNSAGTNCPPTGGSASAPQLTANDFSDWTMVTARAVRAVLREASV